MNHQRILSSALDCISRFKTGKFPLKNSAREVITAKKLNSTERKIFLDLVFSWSRQKFLIKEFLQTNIQLFSTISEQEKEKIILNFIAEKEFNYAYSTAFKELHERYEQWLIECGDESFLMRLGPFFADCLKKSYSSEASVIARGLFDKPKKYLAFDGCDEEALITDLIKHGVTVKKHPLIPCAIQVHGELDIEKLSPELRDHVWFMDAGSQLIAQCIRPKPHERVLDMCVGEGIKARVITAHPCEYYAVDCDARRLEKAKQTLKGKAHFLCEDATALSLPKQSFDWVLLDAPCSGSGVLRRTPDLIHRLTQSDLDKYLKLQKNLLKSALEMVKPQGVVLYATCSLLAMENQQQIDAIIKDRKDVIPVSLRQLLAGSETNCDHMDLDINSLQLLPHIHDCDAFFIAALRKC